MPNINKRLRNRRENLVAVDDGAKDSKKVKSLRIALCIFYSTIALTNALPFIYVFSEDGTQARTVTTLESSVSAFQNGFIFLGIVFILFIILPVVGAIFCGVDRSRQAKSIASFIITILSFVCLLMTVTPLTLNIGSLIMIFGYVLTLGLTVMMALYKSADNHQEPQKEEKVKRVIEIEK